MYFIFSVSAIAADSSVKKLAVPTAKQYYLYLICRLFQMLSRSLNLVQSVSKTQWEMISLIANHLLYQ